MDESERHRPGARPEQIPLPIGRRWTPTFEDYRAGRNEGAVRALRRLLGEPGAGVEGSCPPGAAGHRHRPGAPASSPAPRPRRPAAPGAGGGECPSPAGLSPLYLWGEAGVGKTHLLLAAVSAASRAGARALYVPLRDEAYRHAAMLGGVEELDLLCLDDVDGACSRPGPATALFHAWNRMQAARAGVGGERAGRLRIVVAARVPPAGLDRTLPDLVSRLSACAVYRLHPMSEEDLRELLAGAARRRGIALGEDVVRYLMTRAPREPGALLALLEALDRHSLSVKRPVSVALAREVLLRRGAISGTGSGAPGAPPEAPPRE